VVVGALQKGLFLGKYFSFFLSFLGFKDTT